MKVEKVDDLEKGRPLDDAIRPAVDELEKVDQQGRFRGILFVYDEETDEATVGMFGYNDDRHIIKDADALAAAAREAKI